MRCFRFRLPLVNPLHLAGTTIAFREGLLLESDGRWAEASPLPGFSHETIDEVIAALQKRSTESPALRFALDSVERSLTDCSVRLNALLVSDRLTVDKQFTAVKLKVGRQCVDEDATLVQRVHDQLQPHQVLRLDANRAWNYEQATTFAKTIESISIQYIEEPLQAPNELEQFHAETGVPYALDETLTEQSSLDSFPNCAALVLKPTLLGGRHRIAELAEFGKPLVFSAAFESGVGIARIAQLASEYSTDVPCGLDTYSWLADDVLDHRHTVRDGRLFVESDLQVNRSRLEEVRL